MFNRLLEGRGGADHCLSYLNAPYLTRILVTSLDLLNLRDTTIHVILLDPVILDLWFVLVK